MVIATDTCMFAKVGQLQACVRLGWKMPYYMERIWLEASFVLLTNESD
jgi:hypothetical protein